MTFRRRLSRVLARAAVRIDPDPALANAEALRDLRAELARQIGGHIAGRGKVDGLTFTPGVGLTTRYR